MADEDRQSQQFIREVDEELRRAQLKSVWDRFAPLIIGVCVLVVLLTAGYRGWLWWQERQGAQAGDRFAAALQKLDGGDRQGGEAELAAIAGAGGGYSVLARLRLAGAKEAAGEKAEALAAFDALAADSSADEAARALARIRSATLALGSGDLAGARDRAAPLDQPGGPWRHAAREVLGTAAFQNGELQQARDHFTAIQQDAETPPDLWVRSGMMVGLIDGRLPPPGTEGSAAPAAGETVAPVLGAPAPAASAEIGPPPPAATETPAALEVPAGEAPVMPRSLDAQPTPAEPPLDNATATGAERPGAPPAGGASAPAPIVAEPAPAAAPPQGTEPPPAPAAVGSAPLRPVPAPPAAEPLPVEPAQLAPSAAPVRPVAAPAPAAAAAPPPTAPAGARPLSPPAGARPPETAPMPAVPPRPAPAVSVPPAAPLTPSSGFSRPVSPPQAVIPPQ